MKVSANFTFSKVLFNQDNEDHLVVSLEAPALKKDEKRLPICIVLAIDVSSSMSGDKMDFAKKSAIKLVDHLQPDDYFGVVTFGYDAKMFITPTKVGDNKAQLKNRLGDLYAGGNTNFSGGMLMAFDAVNKLDLGADYVTRVVMLTDGQANAGVVKDADLLDLAKNSRGRISLSAFGYGEDCSQELLSTLAAKSDGGYSFIGSPDDALTAFGKELGGLISVHAQNIELKIQPTNGHEIVEVVSDVDVEEDGDGIKVTLADILAEEKRHVVVKMKLAEQKQAGPREVNVVDVQASYSEVNGGTATRKTAELKAKVQFVKDGNQDKADQKLDAIVALAQVAKAQIEAEELAQRGNFTAAAAAINTVGSTLHARGLSAMESLTKGLVSNYQSQGAYRSSSATRSATKGLVTRSYTTSTSNNSDLEAVSATLAVAGLSTSNTSRDATAASFADTSGTYADAVVGNDLSSVAGVIVNNDPITTSAPTKATAKTRRLPKSRSKRW